MCAEHEKQLYGDLTPHIQSVENNIADFNSSDVAIFFEKLDSFQFRDVMRMLCKKYKAQVGSLPKFDLVLSEEMLGQDDNVKKMNLRRLKAMREDYQFFRKVITSITVKGDDRERLIGFEPNVFASDVRFVQF